MRSCVRTLAAPAFSAARTRGRRDPLNVSECNVPTAIAVATQEMHRLRQLLNDRFKSIGAARRARRERIRNRMGGAHVELIGNHGALRIRSVLHTVRRDVEGE
ncbi:MAG: hypothetical protein ACLPVY_18700 [Acidimicrobiia bacterium]